jgi:hypothetical protein
MRLTFYCRALQIFPKSVNMTKDICERNAGFCADFETIENDSKKFTQ